MAHLQALLAASDVEVAYLCDVDKRRLGSAIQTATQRSTKPAPRGVQDMRQILDDREVDAVFLATPNHWHAPGAILACQSGKHVYVEKPGSHNCQEAEWLVAAARAHRRVVQMGNQRRTWPAIREGIQRLQEGIIGPVRAARCWYNAARPSMGRGRTVEPPAELDYELWQGPAPRMPYVDNLVHYNWHWRWHWGGGELANNGVHGLDLARWGLGVGLPSFVTFSGGRLHFQDDQTTPDTGAATFEYPGKFISWDVSSCHPRKSDQPGFVHFYGDGGVLEIGTGAGYVVKDLNGKEIERKTGPGGESEHIANFLDAIRGRAALNSDIAEGQDSAMLCHLGNIAYRSRSALTVDAKRRSIVGNRPAAQLWGRDYANGWHRTLRAATQVARTV